MLTAKDALALGQEFQEFTQADMIDKWLILLKKGWVKAAQLGSTDLLPPSPKVSSASPKVSSTTSPPSFTKGIVRDMEGDGEDAWQLLRKLLERPDPVLALNVSTWHAMASLSTGNLQLALAILVWAASCQRDDLAIFMEAEGFHEMAQMLAYEICL